MWHRLCLLSRLCELIVVRLQVDWLRLSRILWTRCRTCWIGILQERRVRGSAWNTHRTRYRTAHVNIAPLQLMSSHARRPCALLHRGWRSLLRASGRGRSLVLHLYVLKRLTGSSLYDRGSSGLLSVHLHPRVLLLHHLRLHLGMQPHPLLHLTLGRLHLIHHLIGRITLHVHGVRLAWKVLMLHMRVHVYCLLRHRRTRMDRLHGNLLLTWMGLTRHSLHDARGLARLHRGLGLHRNARLRYRWSYW